MDIIYTEYKPSPQLAPFIECYWLHTFNGVPGEESPVQCCVPLGMLEVLIHPGGHLSDIFLESGWQQLPRGFFHGIYDAPVNWKVKAPARIFGIRFKPEMFHNLFDVPAASLFCNFICLEEFFGDEAKVLCQSVYGQENIDIIIQNVERYFMQRLTNMRQHNYVTKAAHIIRASKGNITIEEISSSVGVSTRQLQRGFKDMLGTTPKSYLRIIRFRNALTALREEEYKDWVGLSCSLGYSDQAHFIREFKEFAGDAPQRAVRNPEKFHKKPTELTDSLFF